MQSFKRSGLMFVKGLPKKVKPRLGRAITHAETAIRLLAYAAALALLAKAAYSVAQRITFPFDIYIWSESPFLTNMMKLRAGQPFYGDPGLANSYVYAPGLEYFHYWLLSPFGLDLNIVAHRALIVLWGVSSACIATACTIVLYPAVRKSAAIVVAIFCLVIFANFTSDVVHPDSLHVLVTMSVFLLTLLSIKWSNPVLIAAAIALSAAAFFVKQTGGLLPVAIVLSCLLGYRDLRCSTAVFLSLGAVAAMFVPLLIFWHVPWAKFYTYDVMSKQGINLLSIARIIHDPPALTIFFGMALIPAQYIINALKRPETSFQTFAITAIFFVIGALPDLIAYVKVFGNWNNTSLIRIWPLLYVMPLLVGVDLRWSASYVPFFVMLWSALPAKTVPDDSVWRFGREIQHDIQLDIASGRKVLLAHGTTFLINSGVKVPPIDRAVSVLEMLKAQLTDGADTAHRIDACYYDKIYLNVSAWYSASILAAIEKKYRLVGTIQRGKEHLYFQGWQSYLVQDVKVYERNCSH